MPVLGVNHMKRIGRRAPVAQDCRQCSRLQIVVCRILKSLNNPKSRRGSREMGIAFIDAEIVWNADFQRLAILSEAKRKGPPGDRREIAYQFVAVAQLLRIGRDAMILQITRRRAGNLSALPRCRAISVESFSGPPRITQSTLPLIKSTGRSATPRSIRISG